MISFAIINFLLPAFLGYLLGRFGDYYLNFWLKDPPAPHHWIYGFILMIAGFFFFKNNFQLWTVGFGAGFLVSDLKDFLSLEFYGKDNKNKTKRKFWNID